MIYWNNIFSLIFKIILFDYVFRHEAFKRSLTAFQA